ncbi:DUF397 domain-containing protein [Streptomyces sp. ALB3]|uniref:DUF397 domain-containing protein n=1 Tax=Streptomyces sp. ALB3 TaxID=3374278 RepID=UPI0037B44213
MAAKWTPVRWSRWGGACIEVAYDWCQTSHSNYEGEACVEVATCPDTVHVRDSKVTAGPTHAVAPAAWTAFPGGCGHGLTGRGRHRPS